MTPALEVWNHRAVVAAAVAAALAGVRCSMQTGDAATAASSEPVTITGPVHPAASSALCLDVEGQSTANGAGVQVAACSGNASQQWTYDGTALRVYGTKCLDVTGGSTANGTKLQIWDCVAGNHNQMWTRSGSTIVWSGHGQCADLTDGLAQSGTPVQSWACTSGNRNQQWTFGGGPVGSSSGGSTSSSGGSTSSSGGSGGGPAVKFVVYLDDWSGGYGSWANKIDFSKMTHLNLAFVEATTDNNWRFVDGQSDSDVQALVAKAHAAGVKVIASLGGGGTDSTVVNQYSNPNNDDALVANVDAFLNRLNLDGADVDVEKESRGEVGDNYGTFVSKLIATLHPEGKVVTAAVAQYLQPYMNDDTLHSFDWVNIMTYSPNTGDYANQASFYTSQKGLNPAKITLGVISESDQRTSVSTTQSIVQMSKSYGGVMLWDLAEDSTDQSSVYAAIQGSL